MIIYDSYVYNYFFFSFLAYTIYFEHNILKSRTLNSISDNSVSTEWIFLSINYYVLHYISFLVTAFENKVMTRIFVTNKRGKY